MNNTTDRFHPTGHTENSNFQTVSMACGILLLLVFLCSLILTTSVLWALWKTNQLQSLVYRMVAFILIDEFLIRIFGSPLVLTSMMAGRWLYGDFGCVFYAFWMTWLGVTATSLFTCVAVERYLIICLSDISHRMTKTFVDTICLICYLHGFVWAFLPLVGVNRYVYEPTEVSCTPNWSPDGAGYILGLFSVCFLMPVVVSLFCYSAIFHMVRRRRVRTAATLRNTSIAEKDVAFTLILTMAAFLFAWTPYSIIGLHNIFGFAEKIHISKELALVPLLTAKTAGMWNPLIFSFNNREVRTFLAKSLHRAKESLKSRVTCQKRSQILPETEIDIKNNELQNINDMQNDNANAIESSTPGIEMHPIGEATTLAPDHRISVTRHSMRLEIESVSVC